ncbi:MAG: DUF1778 domain-containing protein [Planctomycetes bacterium]|nr:DUF1778 domain-containing protein [Planctomycetota bacterium]
MVRLDPESKSYLSQAAELRRVSVSAYEREVTVAQARREVVAARGQAVSLTPEEQLLFRTALHEAPQPTQAQRALGR